MTTFALAFLLSVLAIAGLAVGIFVGRAPIKGSCGGIACQRRISCGACKARGPSEGTE